VSSTPAGRRSTPPAPAWRHTAPSFGGRMSRTGWHRARSASRPPRRSAPPGATPAGSRCRPRNHLKKAHHDTHARRLSFLVTPLDVLRCPCTEIDGLREVGYRSRPDLVALNVAHLAYPLAQTPTLAGTRGDHRAAQACPIPKRLLSPFARELVCWRDVSTGEELASAQPLWRARRIKPAHITLSSGCGLVSVR